MYTYTQQNSLAFPIVELNLNDPGDRLLPPKLVPPLLSSPPTQPEHGTVGPTASGYLADEPILVKMMMGALTPTADDTFTLHHAHSKPMPMELESTAHTPECTPQQQQESVEKNALMDSSSGSLCLLPNELVLHVLSFADWRTLGTAQTVCNSWRAICREKAIYASTGMYVRQILWTSSLIGAMLQQSDQVIERELIEAPQVPTKDSRGVFLKQTLEKLEVHFLQGTVASQLQGQRRTLQREQDEMVDEQYEPDDCDTPPAELGSGLQFPAGWRPEYVYLLALFNNQLADAHHLLGQVCAGEVAMGQNFDVVEMALCRYLHQFQKMFSGDGCAIPSVSSPASLIEDQNARDVWVTKVGADRYYTSFRRFYRDVISPEASTYDYDYYYAMGYLLNFPKDDTVSVAKWNTLVNVFGPYDELYINIKAFVGLNGFLGFVNRIAAEEILREYPDQFMMRFSRTLPDALAFSTYHDGVMRHTVNSGSYRKSLCAYINTNYPGLKPVPLQVNDKMVCLHANRLTGYCSRPSYESYYRTYEPLVTEMISTLSHHGVV
eukprot:TRINITY_DN7434_c0_g1_i1.p1 TRINITY_DN7434_c0_g1~~TRINITY_DN7434_c0_g1_i1.p1  ORF type:complete len:550 (-),score=69.33 TRINITY_DN7434_c0_g1_i1:127-1776(-)